MGGISGSTIKSWFQYRCERKTRYETMDPAELAAVPVVKDDREQPWADLGVRYEDRVVSRLAREQGVLRERNRRDGLEDDRLAPFLRGEGSARYAAQVNLRPRRMPARWDRDGLTLRNSLADLIERDLSGPRPRFRVIDIKATRSAKAFHRTQVAFYALLLEVLLQERGIDAEVDAEGEIWRIPDDGSAEGDDWTAEAFRLRPYSRVVDEFCAEVLPGIVRKAVNAERDETFFHLYFKCEQCSYLPHCRGAVSPDRPPERRDVSAVAGLTHEAKRNLLRAGIRSVSQLAKSGVGIGKMDGAGWSLARRAETLVVRAKALAEMSIRPVPEAQTFLMPPVADAALFLVADHDPVDDGLVTLGYLYVHGDTVREHIQVLQSPDRQAEADALVEVFTRVVADLSAVDTENAQRAARGDPGLQAHIFLYEPTEATAIQNAVKRHLDDPRVRAGLLDMVRLFPPEEIIPQPEYRGMEHMPATAVRSVVEQLFAVPAAVSYDLRQVTGALTAEGLISAAYAPDEIFARPFSAMLAMEVGRGLREGREGAPDVAAVRADVAARLAAVRGLVGWLQGAHAAQVAAGGHPLLRLNKQPFRLQNSFDPLQAGDLDLLRALELLEARAGMLDTLIKLSQPATVRREAGRAIGPMRLVSAPKQGFRDRLLLFEVPAAARDVDVSAGAFGLILSDGQPDLVLEPRLWEDLACELKPARRGDGPGRLRVTVSNAVFDGPTFTELRARAGEANWWLDQTFLDLNGPKVEAYLTYLAAGRAA